MITIRITNLKHDFLSYLLRNRLNPSYPLFDEVLNDEVAPDTVAEQSFDVFDIFQVRQKNFKDDVYAKVKETLNKRNFKGE